jgi:HEAT repeat protein
MSRVPYRFVAGLAAGLLLTTAAPRAPHAQTSDDRSSAVANQTISERVDQAFAAMRSGDLAPSGGLEDAGPAIIPAVVPYLRDGNEDVRRHAVTLLGLLESADAAPHLAAALSDPSDDIVRRASTALYEIGADALRDPSVAEALVASVLGGNDSGGAILLLGYVAGERGIAALNKLRERGAGQSTELFNWSPVVPVPFAADVALTRLGDQAAKARILATIGDGDFDKLSFLLYALRDIEDRNVLRSLADASLADQRPAQGDAPSGADLGIRLADVAAAQFVKRFGLSVGSGTTADRPLTEAELVAVRDALSAQF